MGVCVWVDSVAGGNTLHADGVFLSEKEIDINKVILQKEEVQNIKWISKDDFNNLIKNGAIVPSVLRRFNMIKDKLKIDW